MDQNQFRQNRHKYAADLLERAPASLIDGFIVLCPTGLVFGLIYIAVRESWVFWVAHFVGTTALILYCYSGYRRTGSTIGMRMQDLKLVDFESGQGLTRQQAFRRSFGAVLSSFGSIVTLGLTLQSPLRRQPADLWANTLVIQGAPRTEEISNNMELGAALVGAGILALMYPILEWISHRLGFELPF